MFNIWLQTPCSHHNDFRYPRGPQNNSHVLALSMKKATLLTTCCLASSHHQGSIANNAPLSSDFAKFLPIEVMAVIWTFSNLGLFMNIPTNSALVHFSGCTYTGFLCFYSLRVTYGYTMKSDSLHPPCSAPIF